MRNGSGNTSQEAPLNSDDDDRYGFPAVAEGLAKSILSLNEEGGTVIGIEGRWGAGKTSLLNLLLNRLKSNGPVGTRVLRFSPWLNGPGGSLAETLLLPVADILQKEEARIAPAPHGLKQHIRLIFRRLGKSRNAGTALEVLKYLQQTSGRLAPLADFTGNFVPGFSLASKGMDALAKFDISKSGKTADDLRNIIEARLSTLGLTFIVVIDDLDRLEPEQAVEVLRLVRSVANFSRFRYVMCYDRDVLAHAIQQSLGVENGHLYLQKIVPLSFNLPRPEAFTLRRHFCDDAISLFREVNGAEPNKDILEDLNRAAIVYGEALSTPREVNQALEAIRFRYAGLRDYVWFPDLCLLQLIRVVNPALYDWTEHYLSERSVVITGDGIVAEEEEKNLSESLSLALKLFSTHAARSAWELGTWVPGVQGGRDDGAIAFQREDVPQEDALTAKRRLASPVYWRYYFAFSAPGNVLSEEDIHEIVRLAAEDRDGLTRRLMDSVTDNGVSSRTWFEHILTRLTPALTLRAEQPAREGLLVFLFNHGDEVLHCYRKLVRVFRYQRIGMEELATQLIVQMLAVDRPAALNLLQELLVKNASTVWVASYFRDVMWLHGAVGRRPGDASEMYLSAEELEKLRLYMAGSMEPPHLKNDEIELDGIGSYLWAWRDIAGEDIVRNWTKEIHTDEAKFLLLLLSLRTQVSSSNKGTYLKLEIERAEKLTGQTGQFQAWLDEISGRNGTEFSDLMTKVQESIQNGKNW